MSRLIFPFLILAFAAASLLGDEPSENVVSNFGDRFAAEVAPLLKEHCVHCHGQDGESEGDVSLVDLDVSNLVTHPEMLSTLADVLALREMPPAEEPQPTEAKRQQAVEVLKALLAEAVSKSKGFGRVPLRRMNRFQYNNAVKDLLNLKCTVFVLPERMMREHKGYFKPASRKLPDLVHVGSRPLGKSQMIEPRLAGVTAFPQDLRAEHGFDNRGDHLSLSPLLMESFLRLGRSIVESPDFGPRTVGIWTSFFEPPRVQDNNDNEIRQRLEPFLRKAFRLPVAAEVLDRYCAFVQHSLESGGSFTDAMKDVAAAVIASPRFLYLYDRNSNQQRLSDHELASRLSFFLWGSLPDQRLLTLADEGRLHQPELLLAEVDRMLDDHRVKRFCDSFPAQWLQLERIISSVPNRKTYPKFYFAKYRMSMHMMMEPLLLFEAILIEDRSILELIDSPFTYRSSSLDKLYYGNLNNLKSRAPPTVVPFHRVKVTDRREGGVITNAAVMTMTSGPDRTQPITRGAWLATVVFNKPPEPPPADVPPLDEGEAEEEAKLTLRERLALHRERASCKGCHQQIDPLGFALENYGPTGKWRDAYANGREIDMQGQLFRKHDFADVVQFKDAMLAEKARFVRGFATHLLSFAVARQCDSRDSLAIESIAKATAADGYRMRSLLKRIVLSDPFQSK